MGHLAKQRDASFFRVFFNPYRYGVLTFDWSITMACPKPPRVIFNYHVYQEPTELSFRP